MRLPSLRRILLRGGSLPFDMFDGGYSDAEARRARRMESIYHAGQARIWDGRDVLGQLVAKHGTPKLPRETARALARVFAIIMWGSSRRGRSAPSYRTRSCPSRRSWRPRARCTTRRGTST